MRFQSLFFSVCAVSLVLVFLTPTANAFTEVVNASYDGSVGTGINTTWPAMRIAQGDAVRVLMNKTWAGMTEESHLENNTYDDHWRALVTWDTSGIPDDATITSAVVSVYGAPHKMNQLGTVNFAIIDAYPRDPLAYEGGDYSRTTFTRMAGDITFASYTIDAWNNWTLNPLGRNNISKTGVTTFMFTHSADVDNSSLNWVDHLDLEGEEPASGYNFLGLVNASGAYGPFITIEYTSAASPGLTVSASLMTVTAGTPVDVTFTVRNATSTLPVNGALVTLTGAATGSGTTGTDGNTTIRVNATTAGSITATATLTGYSGNATTITAIAPLPALTVSASPSSITAGIPRPVNFTVRNTTSVVSGATVSLTGVASGSNLSGADGNATIIVNAANTGTITATANLNGYVSNTTTVTATAPIPVLINDKIGISQNGVWYLDTNGNGTFDGGVDGAYNFGAPGWIPMVGDWNATGNSYIGVTNGQQWYLDWNGNGTFDTVFDKSYNFGAPGWTPIVGYWNATNNSYIGVTNGQQWYLDWDGNGTFDVTDMAYNFGAPGWTSVVGDWNATGNSYIGVTNGQQWYLDWNGNGVWDGVDKAYTFGAPGWTSVTGDWNNDGKTDIGVTNGQQWYLDINNNGAFDGGVDKAYNFGAPGWTSIVGDWNATGNSNIGVTNGQQWYLDWNGNGVWDGVDKAYTFGAPGWKTVVGKWN